MDFHLAELALQIHEGVEVLVLLAREVEDFVLGPVIIHLPLQRVRQGIDLVELAVDELLCLHVGGQTRFSGIVNVSRCQRVEETLRAVGQNVRAGHGDDTCAFHVVSLEGAAVLSNPLGTRFDADAEVLGGRRFKPGGIPGHVVV